MIFKRTTTYEKQLIEEKEKLRNIDYWTSYLKTASMQYKHSFDIQTAIHAADPAATACAGADFWNSKDCNINPDAKPIYVSVNGRTQKLFDVSDVTGQFKTSYWIWSMQDKAFDLDFTETVNSKLNEKYKVNSDVLEETLYDIALRKTAEKFGAESELYNIVSESAAFVAIHRCCPDTADMTPESLNGLSSLDIDEIGNNVTVIAREILNEVEKIVKQERIEIIKRSIADEHEQDREQEVPENSSVQRNSVGVGRTDRAVSSDQRQADTANRGRNTELSPQSRNVETGRNTVLEDEKRSPLATNKPNIIGNTEFKYIPQKSYRKFENDIAQKMIPLIDESGIKYSGRIKDNETTFTVSRPDVEKLLKIAEQAKENVALETEEIIEDDPPDTAEYSKEKFTKNPDTWSVTWDYYNPEGNNGNGQFVSIQIYDDDIEKAMQYANGDVEIFIDYINENCKTELIDRGTEDFEDFEKHFIEDNYDLLIDVNSGNTEVYNFLSDYLNELQKDVPEKTKLFTLSDVITEYYSSDNTAAESEGGTWKIQPIENGDDAELLHNGQAECSISFENGTMTVKPYTESSGIPAMVKGALQECMPNFKVVLEEYKKKEQKITANAVKLSETEVADNIDKNPTEEEVLFEKADLAMFLAERSLSSDMWEDMAYPLFENGYLEKHRPSVKGAYSYRLSEPEFYDIARRYRKGEDIRKELALGLLEHTGKEDIEFVFDNGKISDRTYYYPHDCHLSLHKIITDNGFNCSFNDMERFVSFEDIGKAFLDRTYEEFDDISYWWVRDEIMEQGINLTDDTVKLLIDEFDSAKLHGWDTENDPVKINRIKKALDKVLGDYELTEKVFAIIAKEKYHVTIEKKLITLQDVVAKYFGNDCESAESADGTWKLSVAEGDKAGELYHNGVAVCGVYNLGDKMSIEPYEELTSFPKMLADAMIQHNPDKSVEIKKFERTFETPLDKAKYYIDVFCEHEYSKGGKGDYDDLHNVGIAYTTLTDDELPVQITADLVDFKMTYEFDGEVYDVEQYDSLESMIENNLKWLDFDTLVSVPEDVIERHTKTNESTLHFGMLGNGTTVYDTSRTDKETNDYPTVAHISDEGVVNIYDNTLSESDMQLINSEAQKERQRFYVEWDKLTTEVQYGRLLDRADVTTLVNINRESLTMEEKIAKYMPFVFFKEGERPEPEKSNIKYQIYQLPMGGKYHGIRFESMDTLKKSGIRLNHADYEFVYEGMLDEFNGTATLESIFTKFNTDHPDDFKGHSLSMSDVIVVKIGNEKTAYYCDDIGFTEMPDFFKEKEIVTEKPIPETTLDKESKQDRNYVKTPFIDDVNVYTVLINELLSGKGLQHDKNYVQKYFDEHSMTTEELADFIKSEYGTDGHIGDDKIKYVSYSENGITLDFSNGESYLHSWNNVAVPLETRLKDNTYLTETEVKIEKTFEELQGSLFDNIDNTAEKEDTVNISENDSISIGDKFKRKIDGAVVEVVSLSGVLPWYQDDVTIKRIEGTLEITENISADKLLDENRYEPVVNISQVNIINLRKVGNFYEVYGDEAIAVSNTLGLNLTVKNGLEMVSFPDNKKSEYSDKLRDAGYTVLIEEVFELNPSKRENLDNAVEEVSEKNTKDNPENFSITVDEYDLGGAKSKFKANVEAIKMLKQLIAEDRKYANPEEQAIMAKYTGWGGLANAFDENRSDWSDEYAELKSLLTEEEYVSARSTVTDAFYTPPFIIHSIYKALDNFGFMSGKILDPSTGIGNFIGCMPVEMKNRSSITATEVDKISGRIAQYLYPLTNVEITGFEKKNLADNSFDVVVGNIPFGSYKINDRRYNKHNFAIHDYFVAKSLDKVRAGGIVAFITSISTMDKQNSSVRKYISDRAELLGAIRLPNNAFKSYAGTEVTSDIIFLKKREHMIDIADDWVYTGKYQNENGEFTMNQYFIDNSDMVLGNVVLNKLYGRGTSVEAFENADLKDLLEKAVSKIKGKYIERTEEITEEKELENAIPAEEGVRNFSYTIVDDKIYYRQGNSMLLQNFMGKKKERMQGMIAISSCVHELLDMQLQGYPEMSLSAKRLELNELYESFTKKHGLLNSRENISAFSEDVSAPLLLSLENVKDGKLIGKADIFTKTTLKPPEKVTSVTNAHDALIVSISENAKVDLDFMSGLLNGMDKKQIVMELKGDIYYSPETEEYQTADEYLSGNIRNKLKIAKAFLVENPDMADNISALENAMPESLQAADIVVKLGASWVDTKYIEQFIYEKFEIPITSAGEIKVGHNNYSANWNVENKSYLSAVSRIVCTEKFGTKRKNALEILEASLNQRDISVYDMVYNSEKGKDERVINHDETLLARQKQDAIEREFTEWIFADAERRNDLVEKYNVLFNSTRNRQYDGSHLNFEGMNANIELRKHQRDAIAHALYGGNTLFAHKVGAGKSYEMIATAMEGKRLGLHNKTMIAVPNHMTLQFANDFLQLYPNANILVADKKDFAKNNRRKLCAKIATGDFDAVIIGHSQLVKIPISKEREKQYLQDQIDEILECINDEKQRDGKSFAVKDMERTRKNLEERLEKLVESPVKDNTVTFEELGIDRLIIDEADLFKNLPVMTKMRNISGIAANTNVQKTQDLYLKCQYINEITGGKGITFATGTPISNSVTEAYIMNKYLDPYGLAEKDMRSFDAWAANFAQRVTKLEFAPTGKGFRQKTRISKFNNLPELMQMFKKFTDIKMAEDLKLPEPECERHIVKAERSDIQAQLMESLSERAEKIHNKQVTPDQDNMLLITSDGTKIGLDPRLINPLLPDFEGSKVNLCVNNIFDIYNSTSADKLTQVIFCDYSTPKYGKTEGFSSVYEDIKQKLMAKGIPENEIAFIHDCKNDKQKQQLFDKVKSGDVRVIIGSTQKMGAGTNIQDRLYAMHHLDCPWKPRDLQQRLGRMKRQGNMNEKVHEYIYVTQDTFDAYRFQTVENKQGYISQIMSNSNPLRSCEDVSSEEMGYAAVKAACVGNPLIKEKMELDIAVNELQVLKKGFNNSRYKLEDDVNIHLPKKIVSAKTSFENSLQDIETVKRFPKRVDDEGKQYFYGLILNGKRYTDKEQAGTELINAASKVLVGNLSKRMKIGEYKGFQLEAYFDVLSQKTKIDICGQNKYTIELGQSADGNIQRMDNKINAIPEISNDFRVQHDNAVKQLEDAKLQLALPFPQEQELAKKQARLDFLNAELSKENEDKLLGKDNDKSFEIATEAEKKEAEEREKQRVQKELDGDFDLSEM